MPRKTKRKPKQKKGLKIRPANVPMIENNLVACIFVTRAEMMTAIGQDYIIKQGRKTVNLLTDPRPVYIEMPDGSSRFWNWVNAKKGIMRDPVLYLNTI